MRARTTGAQFWTQRYRKEGMDPRRITLHLLRDIRGRRNAAEVDRVWEVNLGVSVPPITAHRGNVDLYRFEELLGTCTQ